MCVDVVFIFVQKNLKEFLAEFLVEKKALKIFSLLEICLGIKAVKIQIFITDDF